MSILKSKHSGWTWDMQRTPFVGGGGGGGSQPTQSTSYQTNLPEYAKPYVTTMLEATQKQLFDTQPGAEGTTEITGFKPYTPYSTDPTKYFAGPTGLQQSSYNEAAGMQTPGQFAPATGLAAMSGLGQMGAGADYMRGVTDPSRVGAYMSPYQQAVTDIAKTNAIREAQVAQQQANLGASRQGTYGGARQALMQSEREKNLLSNLSNIQAQGSQSAYDKAIQSMQYGSNLGLQGLQGAGQAAATLGQLGASQQQADLARINAQNTLGGQQQQYQQGIINQAIQDYATAQQYPMMQLGFMSNMLRGLPMQATSTQTYQAQPNLTTQAISGLGTAAGAYKAFGFKEGGAVPGYAGSEGSVVSGMRAKLEALADSPGGEAQVAKIAQTSPSQEMRTLANEVLLDKEQEKRAAAQAEQSIAQDQGMGMGRGLANAPAPVLDTMAAASGGIIAFADEGEVEYDPTKVYNDPYQVLSDEQALARQEARRKAMGIGEAVSPEYREFLASKKGLLEKQSESDVGLNMIDFFSRMNKAGPTVSAAIEGARESLPGIMARRKDAAAREEAIAKGEQTLYGQERADKLALLNGTDKEREQALKNIAERNKAKITNQQRTTDLMQVFNVELADLGAKGKDINDPTVRKTAMDNAQRIFGGKGAAQEGRDRTALVNAIKADPQIGEKGLLRKELRELKLTTPPKDPQKLAEYNAKIDNLEQKMYEREMYLERKHLGGGQQPGSSDTVTNVDNLPPKK